MTKRGFTLVETIVTIAMTSLVFVTLGILLSYFYKTNAYTLEQTTAVEQARKGVESAMLYIREASYASDGSYPIANAATSSITFYANIDNDALVEKITYKLVRGTFYRTIAEPSGNPLTYIGASISTSTIATSVTNGTSTPVFTYFSDTGVQLSSPVNISKVASIKTTIMIDVNMNRAPVAFTLSGGATLRNLRDQL
jgi:type II secretory pathway pseudopilin PulG